MTHIHIHTPVAVTGASRRDPSRVRRLSGRLGGPAHPPPSDVDAIGMPAAITQTHVTVEA
jgi:hypothetical protein